MLKTIDYECLKKKVKEWRIEESKHKQKLEIPEAISSWNNNNKTKHNIHF